MYSVWHATMCHTAVNSSILTIKTPSATAVQKSISKDCPVTTKQESPGTGLVVADLLPLFVGATDLPILPFFKIFFVASLANHITPSPVQPIPRHSLFFCDVPEMVVQESSRVSSERSARACPRRTSRSLPVDQGAGARRTLRG